MNLILSDFSCPQNGEIENFVRKSAVDFAKRKISVTHLVMDVQGRLVAIFSLTHKAVKIQEEVLTKAEADYVLSIICFLLIRDNLTKQ